MLNNVNNNNKQTKLMNLKHLITGRKCLNLMLRKKKRKHTNKIEKKKII